MDIAAVGVRTAESIEAGILHCPDCLHEYPIVDGIPIIVPDLRKLLGDRGHELLIRDDLDPTLESLIGDAIGPDTWFDALRQTLSTYGWDGWADLDPAEDRPADGEPVPGAARRCLSRLLRLAGSGTAEPRHILDLGCAAGRTSFDLATAHPGALVLGIDLHLGLLRLAQGAAAGRVSYPRRRIGIAYDRRTYPVAMPDAGRVDFWACDALTLPFATGVADLCAALNLLDCVADPQRLLRCIATAVAPGGSILLATPYDWSMRATPIEAWLGGHSQRAPHEARGEAFLHALLADLRDADQPGTVDWHPRGKQTARFVYLGEDASWPWHTRLHNRSAVQYRTHLVALRRV